jgi:hypothetical protein
MSSPNFASLVRRAWVRVRAEPALAAGLLQKAALAVALHEFGLGAVMGAPGIVNCCAAAVLSRSRLETTEISRGAAHLIADTDLCAVPSAMPSLLGSVLVLEARDGARHPLWPNGPVSVLCYPYTALDGRAGFYIAKLTGADRFIGGFWTPQWTGEDVGDTIPLQHYLGETQVGEAVDRLGRGSPNTLHDTQHHDELARIARFLLTLAVLWEARGTPLRVDPAPGARAGRGAAPAPAVACASVRRVTLRPISPLEESEAQRRDGDEAPETEPTAARGEGAPRANHRTKEVQTRVRAHLQRYRCGPNGERTEYRWKQGKTAMRWASERVTTRVGVAR